MTDNETTNTIIAVSLASAGAIGSAIGYVVQKKGHNQVNAFNNKQIKEEDKKTILTSWVWIIGFIVGVLGSITTASALKFGAQSVVAPLGALTLVANSILATKILGILYIKL